jgi:hypothetical protein
MSLDEMDELRNLIYGTARANQAYMCSMHGLTWTGLVCEMVPGFPYGTNITYYDTLLEANIARAELMFN